MDNQVENADDDSSYRSSLAVNRFKKLQKKHDEASIQSRRTQLMRLQVPDAAFPIEVSFTDITGMTIKVPLRFADGEFQNSANLIHALNQTLNPGVNRSHSGSREQE